MADTNTTDLVQLVLHSRVFPTREKWALVRYIKSSEITEEEKSRIQDTFIKEPEVLKQSTEEVEDQYQQSLMKWHSEIEELIHRIIPHQLQEREREETAQDLQSITKELEEL